VSPDGKLLTTELATQVLDGFIFAMCAKPNQGVKAFIIQQVVIAKRVGTEATLGRNGFLFAAGSFAHAPGEDVLMADGVWVVATGCLRSATGAVLVCFGLENARFGLRRLR